MAMPTLDNSIQFRDVESLCEAYRNCNIASFGFFQHKDLQHSYEGEDIEEGEENLRGWMDLLSKSKTSSVYTFKVYRDIKEGQYIKDNTPCDRSWKCKFEDRPPGYLPPDQYGYMRQLESEMAALKIRLKQLEEGADDEEDEPVSWKEDPVGKVAAIISDPKVQQGINFIKGLLMPGAWGGGAPAAGEPGATMHGIETFDGNWAASRVILDSLNILARTTPDLPDVLHKLARMSTTNLKSYNFYKDMLLKLPD